MINNDNVMIEKPRFFPYIESNLVDYYNSLMREVSGHPVRYKNAVVNALFECYFTNKPKFSLPPTELAGSFDSAQKDLITFRLSKTNEQLFSFFMKSTHRMARPAAEYILTSILITLKLKNIDELYYTPENGLKLYRKNRLTSL